MNPPSGILNMIKTVVTVLSLFGFCLFLFLFWLGYFSSRPPLTIDAATLAGDGSALNYCALPELDGSGLMAADIPKGNTPNCGYTHFPLPILAQCVPNHYLRVPMIFGVCGSVYRVAMWGM